MTTRSRLRRLVLAAAPALLAVSPLQAAQLQAAQLQAAPPQPAPSRAAPVEVAACVVDVASWDTLNVRAGPSIRHRILFALPPDACGVAVEWDACRGNWCPIWYGGRTGWASARYLG
ncbi:SH3 domain-containing protein [Acuticoccus mangrovi]|uniref:SH3 domain-containing protein n=1 Tax=Acuticoccus mangrovi TaxID=2796142 RepID=A0A934MEA4_9HYPH|nr:SH3 domain-containing protein [Acuticoccus mangrovi]MBJ3777282.1 SH3 domain-containing protein [Acuticoccus mangrovi]